MSLAAAARPATIWPPIDPRWAGGPVSAPLAKHDSAPALPTWLKVAGIGLAAAGGIAAAVKFGPALLANHSTGATVAKWGLGIGAVAGVSALLASCAGGGKGHEYVVHFATEPDLTGVPEGEVYNVLRAHHERYAPAVEAELSALKTEGKVTSYSGIIGSNGFVVNIARGHDDEVKQRLAAISAVGDIESADLG
jgi:hypothetical protein